MGAVLESLVDELECVVVEVLIDIFGVYEVEGEVSFFGDVFDVTYAQFMCEGGCLYALFPVYPYFPG